MFAQYLFCIMDSGIERLEFEDGGMYIGQWQGRCAHGLGVSIGPKNGGEYSGKWESGYESCGVYVCGKGVVYAGSWLNGKRHGMGQQIRGNWVYQGEFFNGNCGPQGVKSSVNGDTVYEGSWVNNRFEGFGVETCADGSVYAGLWSKGVRHGMGVRKTSTVNMSWDETQSHSTPSKSTANEQKPRRLSLNKHLLRKLRKQRSAFELGQESRHENRSRELNLIETMCSFSSPGSPGSTKANLSKSMAPNILYGNASLLSGSTTKTIETYAGEWLDDQKSGHGVFESSTGLRYVGSWLKNQKHGFGVLFHPNGKREEGQFENDSLKLRIEIKWRSQKKLKEQTLIALTKATEAAIQASTIYAPKAHESAELARKAAEKSEQFILDAKHYSIEACKLINQDEFKLNGTSWDSEKIVASTLSARPLTISRKPVLLVTGPNVLEARDDGSPCSLFSSNQAALQKIQVPKSVLNFGRKWRARLKRNEPSQNNSSSLDSPSVRPSSATDTFEKFAIMSNPLDKESPRGDESIRDVAGNASPNSAVSCPLKDTVANREKVNFSSLNPEQCKTQSVGRQTRSVKQKRLERKFTLDNSLLGSSMEIGVSEGCRSGPQKLPIDRVELKSQTNARQSPSQCPRHPKLRSTRVMRAGSIKSSFSMSPQQRPEVSTESEISSPIRSNPITEFDAIKCGQPQSLSSSTCIENAIAAKKMRLGITPHSAQLAQDRNLMRSNESDSTRASISPHSSTTDPERSDLEDDQSGTREHVTSTSDQRCHCAVNRNSDMPSDSRKTDNRFHFDVLEAIKFERTNSPRNLRVNHLSPSPARKLFHPDLAQYSTARERNFSNSPSAYSEPLNGNLISESKLCHHCRQIKTTSYQHIPSYGLRFEAVPNSLVPIRTIDHPDECKLQYTQEHAPSFQDPVSSGAFSFVGVDEELTTLSRRSATKRANCPRHLSANNRFSRDEEGACFPSYRCASVHQSGDRGFSHDRSAFHRHDIRYGTTPCHYKASQLPFAHVPTASSRTHQPCDPYSLDFIAGAEVGETHGFSWYDGKEKQTGDDPTWMSTCMHMSACQVCAVNFPQHNLRYCEHKPQVNYNYITAETSTISAESRRDSNLSTSSGTVVGTPSIMANKVPTEGSTSSTLLAPTSQHTHQKTCVSEPEKLDGTRNVSYPTQYNSVLHKFDGFWASVSQTVPNISLILLNIIIILLLVIISQLQWNAPR